jgi:FG-GAP-like repeat
MGVRMVVLSLLIGKLDAAVTTTGFRSGAVSPAPGDRLTLLFGDGRGGFRRSDIAQKTGRTWFVAIGDVNGDRQPDLVTTHVDSALVSVLLGDGRGNFAEAGGSPFQLGQQAWYVGLVDLNRDGRADLVAAAKCRRCVAAATRRQRVRQSGGSCV